MSMRNFRAVIAMAVVCVGMFVAAIWTSGDVSGRLAGTGLVAFFATFFTALLMVGA